MESDLCSHPSANWSCSHEQKDSRAAWQTWSNVLQCLQIYIVYEVYHILFALCTESLGKPLDERGSSPRNSTMKNYLTVFNLFVIMLVTMAVVPFWCCRHLVTKLRRKSAWL